MLRHPALPTALAVPMTGPAQWAGTPSTWTVALWHHTTVPSACHRDPSTVRMGARVHKLIEPEWRGCRTGCATTWDQELLRPDVQVRSDLGVVANDCALFCRGLNFA
jgi:hypothetical protein